MTGALINAVYNQGGFRDWIEAESVNHAVSLLNLRASQLFALFKTGVLQAPTIQSIMILLLSQFRLSETNLQAARTQLRTQFAEEYGELSSSVGPPGADVWIDTVLLFELAADLHEKDEMYIYSITAVEKDLAGAGFFSFLGFLYRSFRDHDYDLGRQKAQSFLTSLSQISAGKLPQLTYTPKPINPIQATPQGGFNAAMIPETNRKELCNALSRAADNMLAQEGVNWVKRKGIETVYLNGKIKGILDVG
jgi:hypothetical protein